MPSEVVSVRMEAEVLTILDRLVGQLKQQDGKATRGHVIRLALCQMAERQEIDVPTTIRDLDASRPTWAERRTVTGSIVYFVQSTGPSGVIKIGTTGRWHHRFTQLQHDHPVPLKVLGTMPGDRLTEEGIHLLFEHVRANGEWFLPDPVLLAYIEEQCSKHKASNGAGASVPEPVVVPPSDVERLREEEDEDFSKMFEGLDGEAVRKGS